MSVYLLIQYSNPKIQGSFFLIRFHCNTVDYFSGIQDEMDKSLLTICNYDLHSHKRLPH